MDKRKSVTQRFEISRKILCVLLACTLMIQTGCITTHVLVTLEEKDIKDQTSNTENAMANQQPLNLKKGQLIRITYLEDLTQKIKRQEGRVKSVTLDAIIILQYHTGYKNTEVRFSFQKVKKIELIKKEMSKAGQAITVILILPPLAYIIWLIAYARAGLD